jgi:hypothetical protein
MNHPWSYLMAKMTTQLDFIVFGPGRSGTGVFATAFNLHPKVFCAIEFLPINADHSTFRMPEDMLRLHLDGLQHRTRSIEILNDKLSHGAIDSYGNKMPSYYFKLDRLVEQLPELKMFYIYRSPVEFVHSWDRRAGAGNDISWHEGKVGIFGALEQIFCLKRLSALSADVTMVSYKSLFFRDPHLMARAVGRLGVDPVEFDQAQFEKKIFGKKGPKAVEHQFYDEFFREFRFDLVDAYFDASPVSNNTDPKFIDVVSKQFADMPGPRRFARFLQKMDPTVQEFAATWRRQLRNQLDGRENPVCHWALRYSTRVNRVLARAGAPAL